MRNFIHNLYWILIWCLVIVGGVLVLDYRAAYACDVTYVTNKQAAFAYLRDQRRVSPQTLRAYRGDLEQFGAYLAEDRPGGKAPGPESSILKLKGTELQQAVDELYVEAAGYYALPCVPNQYTLDFPESDRVGVSHGRVAAVVLGRGDAGGGPGVFHLYRDYPGRILPSDGLQCTDDCRFHFSMGASHAGDFRANGGDPRRRSVSGLPGFLH